MVKESEKETWHQVITPDGRIVWLGWGKEKNQLLMAERKLSFEMVLIAVAEQGLLLMKDTRPIYKEKGQWMLEAEIEGYTHICPCRVETAKNETTIFLKTCYASRKADSRKSRR